MDQINRILFTCETSLISELRWHFFSCHAQWYPNLISIENTGLQLELFAEYT